MSYLFAQTGGHYATLFVTAAAAFLLALVIDLLAGMRKLHR
jgi:hypothetical protein